MKRSNFNNKVYRVVQKIPIGKVMTYGQVARRLGKPKAAQAVGKALHNNPNSEKIPCHRVVNYLGRIAKHYAFGGGIAQRKKLIAEGIEFKGKNHINLKHIKIPLDIF
jgi:methylated-DNA-protein-cysteine methyltransferase related protein